MASANKVILIGNLTRDPELKFTKGTNKAVAEMSIAVNGKHKKANGEEVDDTFYMDIVAYGSIAETCKRILHKGDALYVDGKIKVDTWVDRNTGAKKQKLFIISEHLNFFPRQQNGNAAGNASGPLPYDERPQLPKDRYPRQNNAAGFFVGPEPETEFDYSPLN